MLTYFLLAEERTLNLYIFNFELPKGFLLQCYKAQLIYPPRESPVSSNMIVAVSNGCPQRESASDKIFS
jgi:hypothetical protein